MNRESCSHESSACSSSRHPQWPTSMFTKRLWHSLWMWNDGLNRIRECHNKEYLVVTEHDVGGKH
jgi:hypothetical protein